MVGLTCWSARRRHSSAALPDRFGNQIIVRVADDFDPGEFANRQFAAHVNPAVNVRSVGFSSSDEVIADCGLRVDGFRVPEPARVPMN